MSVASPIESSTPMVSRRPTPYTVAISPYRTVSGRMLSMASGADTRTSRVAGAAPASKFVATTRTCVMPALMATRCPVVASMRASVVSATDQREGGKTASTSHALLVRRRWGQCNKRRGGHPNDLPHLEASPALQIEVFGHHRLGGALGRHVQHQHAGAPHAPQRLFARAQQLL